MSDSVTLAAGGVVLRPYPSGREVLIVHRVKHQDWSLPKGKLDPGESPADAALREVEEETGVRAELGPALEPMSYPIPSGTKHVWWWAMTPVTGDPTQRPADGEVDQARFVPVTEVADLLTYPADLALVQQALATTFDTSDAPRADLRRHRGGGSDR